MSILDVFKKDKPKPTENGIVVLSDSAKENSFIVPANQLGKPIVSVQEFSGLKPIKVPCSQLDPKTDLQYVPIGVWSWVDSSKFWLHEDGTAVIMANSVAYLRFPRFISSFDTFVKVLKLKVNHQIIIAVDAETILNTIKGKSSHNWSSSLIDGSIYPAVDLTEEMRNIAPDI